MWKLCGVLLCFKWNIKYVIMMKIGGNIVVFVVRLIVVFIMFCIDLELKLLIISIMNMNVNCYYVV